MAMFFAVSQRFDLVSVSVRMQLGSRTAPVASGRGLR